MKGLSLVVSLTAGATIACSAPQDDVESGEAAATAAEIGSAFDVNDVSILFPLKKGTNTVPYPQIRVSGVAEPGQDVASPDRQLWSKELWDQVISEAKSEGLASGESGDSDFFKLRGLWHIVGLRFDPCAPGFDDAVLSSLPGDQKNKCIVQLRLIAQPFTRRASADFTAHLVYNLGAIPKRDLAGNAVVQGATKILGKIKEASGRLQSGKTAGQPLGVHPGLEAEMKSGGSEIADLVKSLIKTFTVTPSRAIAFMGLQNGGPEPWTFFAGRVENGVFTRELGPGHGQKAQTLSFIASSGPVMQASRLPVSTAPLFKRSPSAADRALAFKVEDPTKQHFFNTDCISCHTSSARIHDLSLGDSGEISARPHVPANITGYVMKTQAQDDVWNVRNFGYFGDKPTVSGRTAAETVDVVQWLNKNVRAPGAGLNGPGPDCSSADVEVWKCFRDGKKDCLTSCGPAPVPTDTVVGRPPTPMEINPEQAGDPCVTASVGGVGTVDAQHMGRSIVVQLGGNNSACLTRVMGGAFAGGGLSIACSSPAECMVTLPDGPGTGPDSVTITGEEARRFRQFFRVTDGGFFQTRAGGETGLHGEVAGLQIACTSSQCTVTIAADKADLPSLDPSKRINPE